MRGRRTRVVVAALVVLGMVGTLAVGLVGGGRRTVQVPADGPWVLHVGPEHPGLAACTTDPAVEHALTPAILPPAATTVQLYADATRADLDRVLTCVLRDAGRARVEVVRAARGQAG